MTAQLPYVSVEPYTLQSSRAPTASIVIAMSSGEPDGEAGAHGGERAGGGRSGCSSIARAMLAMP